MDATADGFDEHLGPDERLEYVGRGHVVDDGDESAGVIGVTDRRVIFTSRTDDFLEFKHGYVAAMRGRQRTTLTSDGLRSRVVLGTGACLAAVGFLGVLAATVNVLGFVLALAGAASLVAFEYVRRNDLDLDWDRVDDAVEDRSLAAAFERRDVGGYSFGSNHGHLLVGIGVVAIAAFAWLGALASGPLALVLAAVGVGGLGVADYGYRWKRSLDRSGESRRRQREVSVQLADGRLLHLRVDVPDRLDRTLSRVAGVVPGPTQTPAAEPAPGAELATYAEETPDTPTSSRHDRG